MRSVRNNEWDERAEAGTKSRQLFVYVIVALATFGTWALSSSLSTLLERAPVPSSGTLKDVLTLALFTAGALTWAVFVRWATLTLFVGPPARRHAFVAAIVGLVLMLLLVSYDAWMGHMAGQEAELISSMDMDGATTDVPDPGRLTSRTEAYYRAMQSRDSETMYEISRLPLAKTRQSLGEYRSTRGLDDDWQSRPATRMHLLPLKVCACHSWTWWDGSRSLRCLVLLSAVVEGPEGLQQHRFLETWEYLGGEWYERCPGPGAEDCPADPYAEGYCRQSHVLLDR